MIKTLIEQGHAYAVENGDVYFSVRSDETYGEVSGRNIDDLMVGARIEENEIKRDPLDFALWKAAKPGEPSWKSPWGERPPWLAYRMRCHGASLPGCAHRHSWRRQRPCVPSPRKTNARRQRAHGTWLSNTWMHTGMLLVNGEKMSKSLGNFFTLEEVLEEALGGSAASAHAANALSQPARFQLRAPGRRELAGRIAGTAQNLRWAAAHATGKPDAALAQKLADAVAAADAEFKACMDDDFNTAGALGAFFGFITEANSYLDAADGAVDAEVVVAAAEFIERSMGVWVSNSPPQEAERCRNLALAAERAGYAGDDTAEAAEALIAARAGARCRQKKTGPWPMPFVMLWASLVWWWKTPPPVLASRRNNQGLGRFVVFAPAARLFVTVCVHMGISSQYEMRRRRAHSESGETNGSPAWSWTGRHRRSEKRLSA